MFASTIIRENNLKISRVCHVITRSQSSTQGGKPNKFKQWRRSQGNHFFKKNLHISLQVLLKLESSPQRRLNLRNWENVMIFYVFWMRGRTFRSVSNRRNGKDCEHRYRGEEYTQEIRSCCECGMFSPIYKKIVYESDDVDNYVYFMCLMSLGVML